MWAGLALLWSCSPETPREPGVVVVVQEQQPAWVRNFNPLNPTGGARWPTRSGIYEPMAIYNSATGKWVSWLASSFEYADDVTVRAQLRQDVKWSDGTPFTAADVAFTFELVLRRAELDLGGMGRFVEGVEALGTHEVVVHLDHPYSPGLADIMHQPIVPAHVWKDIDDPLKFANEDPVGTGPFTEVRVFRPQLFELGRNPHYWQDVAIEAMRFPAVGSNDQVTLSLLEGEVDWAGAFVPAIDRIYADRDPEHNRYWFPLVGEMIFLYANTTRPPFDDVRVRKAISSAIDRSLVVKIAMYDYTQPANAVGMSDVYSDWIDLQVAGDSDWITFDTARAAALLDEAGLKMGPNGLRQTPDGEPLQIELSAITGWSDWVRASQVIARNLGEVGLDVRMRSYDFGAWFDALGRGDFQLTLGWSASGPTPFPLYQGLMSQRAVRPMGEPATSNWHRYGSAEMEALLVQFEATTDRTTQGLLASEMQRLFVAEAPAIPLFPSPSWGEFRTEFIEGFPSAADPYARLSPNHFPDPLLVMTRLRPAQ